MMWLPPTSCVLPDTSKEHTMIRPTLLPSTFRGVGLLAATVTLVKPVPVCSIITRTACELSAFTLFQARCNQGTIISLQQDRPSASRMLFTSYAAPASLTIDCNTLPPGMRLYPKSMD
eukprot:3002101-Pleurochrysis_carterae.AAC.3